MKTIRLRFANFWPGFDPNSFIKRYLRGFKDEFHFKVSDETPFLVFGPYGGADCYRPGIPQGKYVRIYWLGENYPLDMECCDWAFSYHLDEKIRNPRHFHALAAFTGIDDGELIKDKNWSAAAIAAKKTRFCNFIYANRVPFREEFCRLLSKYKKVDCPGPALNNMKSIDAPASNYLQREEEKIRFLKEYKFTIAFENSTSPGYTTEKLWQPMKVGSIPIYWGNPDVQKTFCAESFISVHSIVPAPFGLLKTEFVPKNVIPSPLSGPMSFSFRGKRKMNGWIRQWNMERWKRTDLQPIVDRIVELDQNPELYLAMLEQPWLPQNRIPDMGPYYHHWRKIFESGLNGCR
jgi:hypothetical protein